MCVCVCVCMHACVCELCDLSLEHPHSVAVTHTPGIVSTSGVAQVVFCVTGQHHRKLWFP